MADFNFDIITDSDFNMEFQGDADMQMSMDNVQIVETGDYDKLANRPIMNRRVIEGDKISADYGLQDKMDAATVAEIEAILYMD